jgi:hypothetical protein
LLDLLGGFASILRARILFLSLLILGCSFFCFSYPGQGRPGFVLCPKSLAIFCCFCTHQRSCVPNDPYSCCARSASTWNWIVSLVLAIQPGSNHGRRHRGRGDRGDCHAPKVAPNLVVAVGLEAHSSMRVPSWQAPRPGTRCPMLPWAFVRDRPSQHATSWTGFVGPKPNDQPHTDPCANPRSRIKHACSPPMDTHKGDHVDAPLGAAH